MLDQTPPATASSYRTKATREDWLEAARTALIDDGVDHVKILTLAQKIGVSRSSFYWYFRDRDDLLDNLISFWRGSNTADIVEHAERPAKHIVEAVLNIFECWTDKLRFDPKLDFAMRDWARRDPALQSLVHREDEIRVDAIRALFERHGYGRDEGFIRARIVYFVQIGYYSLSLEETMDQRLQHTTEYIYSFTGVHPDPDDIVRFQTFARSQSRTQR
ncbi:TetR/AcrR family transcriptional regulator [Mesorhizobium sp. C386A]|uniref:TetR/AcrR family transcriptional regulator n=1 Tax=Mesorhizobium sp. C386A TaxID=2956831 RepID=UPI0003CE3450|nr:TetR family transcriptional regulator [Mesorhizobium sp. LNJC386A00]